MGPEVTEPKDGYTVGNLDKAHLTEGELRILLFSVWLFMS